MHRKLKKPNDKAAVRGPLRSVGLAAYTSPIGVIRVAATGDGILCVAVAGEENLFAQRVEARIVACPEGPDRRAGAAYGHIERLLKEFDDYFGGGRMSFRAPVDLRGTPFEKKVWLALRAIPYGESSTYSRIAERLGAPGAGRAVGNACGKNPVPIVIPCHRVLKADGGLGGYTGGVWIKEALLKLEGFLS